jgi:hypothetical protein
MQSHSDSVQSLARLLGELKPREAEFLEMIAKRLIEGRVYGDPSARPMPTLLEEVMEEQLDCVGWVYPMWARTQKLLKIAKEQDS